MRFMQVHRGKKGRKRAKKKKKGKKQGSEEEAPTAEEGVDQV